MKVTINQFESANTAHLAVSPEYCTTYECVE